ncbi:NAD-dependent dehydratase [Rhizobium panacihumi]|uniref:NAD-dependent dehydratase n=1 Tax=Rhizobium panacihumi TaxID=2008450 RepID=UPI003D7AF025
MMKLLLVGASGLVGGNVLNLALADPRVDHVVAPGRKTLPAHPKLEVPLCDFDRMTGDEAFWHGDAVICTLGTTIKVAGSKAAFERVDHRYPLAVARFMHRRGAQVFVLNSALGADPQSRFFYNRVKGQLEADLATVGFRSLCFARPGLIGGERAERRRGEDAAEAVLKALGPILPRRWRINPAPVIARALLEHAIAAKPGVSVVLSQDLTG